MKIGVLTSVETRHRYFAQMMFAHLPVFAIGYEQTGYSPATFDIRETTPEEARVITQHFAERTRLEEMYFGHTSHTIEESSECLVRTFPSGQLNTPATVDFLCSAEVDTLIVYGTNLIKEPLLSRFSGRIVNMHLGLSPYYRGTATNFYPLLNEEPQYVGATIHLIDAGIDTGPILAHARPEITSEDQPHSIGCKAIQAGIDKLISVLAEWDEGRRKPVPQWKVPQSRLYLRKDYHPSQVVALYQKLDTGMITKYVERTADVAEKIRLID